ncbi:MAG: hypothetical protein M3023_01940 [Pseudomonadota bacterium]|nr:hypothetical protein [Pseudomonadota bacterium]
MKRVLATTAMVVFGFAPAIGAACEYDDESSASVTLPTQLASTPPPAATKAPTRTVSKALAPSGTKQVRAPVKPAAVDQKVAVGTTN